MKAPSPASGGGSWKPAARSEFRTVAVAFPAGAPNPGCLRNKATNTRGPEPTEAAIMRKVRSTQGGSQCM